MTDRQPAALRPSAFLASSHEEEEEVVPTVATPMSSSSKDALQSPVSLSCGHDDNTTTTKVDAGDVFAEITNDTTAPESVTSPRETGRPNTNDDDSDDAAHKGPTNDDRESSNLMSQKESAPFLGPVPTPREAAAAPASRSASLETCMIRRKMDEASGQGPRLAAPLEKGECFAGEPPSQAPRHIVLECDAKAEPKTAPPVPHPTNVCILEEHAMMIDTENRKEAPRKAFSCPATPENRAIGASKDDVAVAGTGTVAGTDLQHIPRSLQDFEEMTRRSVQGSILASGPGAYHMSDPAAFRPPRRVEPSPPSHFTTSPAEYVVEARLVMDESSSDDDTDVAGNAMQVSGGCQDDEETAMTDLKHLVEATPVQRPSAWKKWAWLAAALVAVAAVGTAVGISLNPAQNNPTGTPPETNSTINAPPDRASIPTVTSSDPIGDFRSYLSASTLQVIEESDQSPQARAYQWSVAHPPREGNVVKRLVQRFAMASLYYATGGPEWAQKDGWLNGTVHECDWYYDPSVVSSCPGGSDTVSTVGLVGNQLKGILPPELGLLTSLESLLLSSNENLKGTIPDSFTNMTTLSVVYLPSNRLSGPLPKLPPSTTSVVIWSNQFNGTLPSEYKNLTNLKEFSIRANALSGGMSDDVWTNWKLLELLDISENNLVGRIGPGIGLLTRLTSLGLMENRFSGPLPTELGLLSALTDIFVGGNQFTSTLPTELATMSSLMQIDFYGNALTGTIPSVLCRLSELTELVLDTNMLSGSIPTELASLSKLSGLSLPGNRLTGPIPTQMAALTGLQYLSLESNAFTGPVPKQLGSLTSLSELHLSSNRLNHTLPTELGQLISVYEIDLSHNNVTGTIPTELGLLSSLALLSLHGNGIVGTVPVELCALVRLNNLVVSVDCTLVNCTCGCDCSGGHDGTTTRNLQRRR